MAYKVLVFSPTGGTQKSAALVASAWGDEGEVVDLSDQQFRGSSVSIAKDDVVLVALPCFGGRVPALSIARLKEIDGKGAACVVMCVYGNRAYEDGLVEMADSAQEAGFTVVAGIAAIAEHSIMRQFATGRPDAADAQRLRAFAQQAMALARRKTSAIDAMPGHRPYKTTAPVPLVPAVSTACVKCGTCASTCPVSAIDDGDFQAKPDVCISCMRCIKVCPADARSINAALVNKLADRIKQVAQVRKEAELFA